MAEPAQTSPRRFAALDSWRGVCALMVVLFHLNAATHGHRWLNNGYVAVDFFFVLSGFVIASAYQDRIATGLDAVRFTIRRLGRLYPLHLAVLGVYVLLELHRGLTHSGQFLTGERTLPALISDLLLVQGFNTYSLTWNITAWSISVELWANLAFVALALRLGPRLAWGSGLVALALAALITWPHLRLPLVSSPENERLLSALGCVMEFFLGVWAFNLHRLALGRGLKLPGGLEWPVLAGIVYVFAFAGAVSTLWLAAVFVVAVLVFAREAGPISAVLKRPWPLALGAASYSIYLTHALYTEMVYGLIGRLSAATHQTWVTWTDERDLLVLGGPWAMDLAAVACLALVIASSLMTYRYLEEPARLYFNRLSQRIAPGARLKELAP